MDSQICDKEKKVEILTKQQNVLRKEDNEIYTIGFTIDEHFTDLQSKLNTLDR